MNMQNGNEPKYLTVTEAAKELHVHRHTILRWINSDKLEAIKTPGGHRRIEPAAIQKMLDDAKKS